MKSTEEEHCPLLCTVLTFSSGDSVLLASWRTSSTMLMPTCNLTQEPRLPLEHYRTADRLSVEHSTVCESLSHGGTRVAAMTEGDAQVLGRLSVSLSQRHSSSPAEPPPLRAPDLLMLLRTHQGV